MEMFGQDFENFEAPEEDVDDEPAVETSNPSAPRVDKAKKGKLAAKSTGHTYQFQIMESIGVPRAEVKKFADPYHWLSYFPPIATVSTDLLFFLSVLTICLLRQTTVLWGHA
jgi:leucyl-tRNA synthetase